MVYFANPLLPFLGITLITSTDSLEKPVLSWFRPKHVDLSLLAHSPLDFIAGGCSFRPQIDLEGISIEAQGVL